jgi:hypothetical protein
LVSKAGGAGMKNRLIKWIVHVGVLVVLTLIFGMADKAFAAEPQVDDEIT